MYRAGHTDFTSEAITERPKSNYSLPEVHTLLEIFQHKCGTVKLKKIL
jgi:hypothetical protein